MMCLFVFHSKMPHLQAAENAFLQTACKITKNIGFNIFYGIINFIQKARFNNSAAQKKEKRPRKEALQVLHSVTQPYAFHSFSVFCHVYRECLERELQSLLGEFLVYLFVEVELYSPIIGLVAPHAHCYVN